MIAKIAVSAANFAIDKPYSYAVPQGMALMPGMRVQVPFGRGDRSCEGVVLSLEEGSQEGLKAVACPLDSESLLSPTMLRLAAFKNPDFYRSQAMRLPIYNKPRVICTAEERDGYLALPRGCEQSLIDLLNEANAVYTITDKTNSGKPINVQFKGVLRTEQMPAAEALLSNETGVLSATTAFGKTVIAANLIAQRKVNTLVLVHTQALLNQWKNSLSEFLRINETLPELPKKRGRKKERSVIGQLGGTKNTVSGIVDIAIIQSLISGDEVKELIKAFTNIFAGCDDY